MGRKKLAVPDMLENQQVPFAYSLSYSFGSVDKVKVVKSFTIAELFASYGKILWEEGRHKANVKSFLGEINEIFFNTSFSTRSDRHATRTRQQQRYHQQEVGGAQQVASESVQDG